MMNDYVSDFEYVPFVGFKWGYEHMSTERVVEFVNELMESNKQLKKENKQLKKENEFLDAQLKIIDHWVNLTNEIMK